MTSFLWKTSFCLFFALMFQLAHRMWLHDFLLQILLFCFVNTGDFWLNHALFSMFYPIFNVVLRKKFGNKIMFLFCLVNCFVNSITAILVRGFFILFCRTNWDWGWVRHIQQHSVAWYVLVLKVKIKDKNKTSFV